MPGSHRAQKQGPDGLALPVRAGSPARALPGGPPADADDSSIDVSEAYSGLDLSKPSKLARLRRKVMSVQQLWIWPFTHYKPTNQVMLCYRTLFQDLRQPGANDDHLAARFRDELMPLRGWVHRKMPMLLHINKVFINAAPFGCPGIMTYLDARTRWLDEEVLAAQGAGAKQVVVVAAGFDTRAYRLRAPGVSFFEVDLPEASERKRKLVDRTLPAEQYPRPTYIAADLSRVSLADALLGRCGSDAGSEADSNGSSGGAFRHQSTTTISNNGSLSNAGSGSSAAQRPDQPKSARSIFSAVGGTGFNPRVKTLFTVEGLLYYLPPEAVTRLLKSIRSIAAPGSRVAFDFLHADVFSGKRYAPGYETLRLTVKNKGEPKRSGLDPATLRPYLASLGWRLTYMPKPKDVAAAMYPDAGWSRLNPVLPPFYNFAVAETM
ncbi:hypothetical protein GPECTOR_1g73 [Gonium pectorale]|uniref:S-adenosyl-L-methionine-dependent methyltransferase n=1 Tax=Gonium pectorale TaxID=33097 RepID=A0A150H5B0_GONPE|nr:hypothetical protein GPECTOR_1g73 [Gonium pectorale]|eukprot:KXZ56810.1 hypothetical protein GPECTOR_1g73 [Gonium pectorale]